MKTVADQVRELRARLHAQHRRESVGDIMSAKMQTEREFALRNIYGGIPGYEGPRTAYGLGASVSMSVCPPGFRRGRDGVCSVVIDENPGWLPAITEFKGPTLMQNSRVDNFRMQAPKFLSGLGFLPPVDGPVRACETSANCPPNSMCENGVCVKIVVCDNDAQCAQYGGTHQGGTYACISGTCGPGKTAAQIARDKALQRGQRGTRTSAPVSVRAASVAVSIPGSPAAAAAQQRAAAVVRNAADIMRATGRTASAIDAATKLSESAAVTNAKAREKAAADKVARARAREGVTAIVETDTVSPTFPDASGACPTCPSCPSCPSCPPCDTNANLTAGGGGGGGGGECPVCKEPETCEKPKSNPFPWILMALAFAYAYKVGRNPLKA